MNCKQYRTRFIIRNKALKQSKVRYADIYSMLMTMIYLNYTVTSQMRHTNVLDMVWIYLQRATRVSEGCWDIFWCQHQCWGRGRGVWLNILSFYPNGFKRYLKNLAEFHCIGWSFYMIIANVVINGIQTF